MLWDSKDRNLFVRDERRTIAMTANAQNQSNSATLCVLKRLLYSCLALNIGILIIYSDEKKKITLGYVTCRQPKAFFQLFYICITVVRSFRGVWSCRIFGNIVIVIIPDKCNLWYIFSQSDSLLTYKNKIEETNFKKFKPLYQNSTIAECSRVAVFLPI